MPSIQIGKYTRPGIFINEYDQSVILTPTFQGINTLVIGVSKQGPPNTPVLLNNVNDLTSIFGPLDRTLERSGSFFHRTITQMLGSSPVYGMNLLLTDNTLDTIQYQSLSTSTSHNNDIIRTGPYSGFYNTTGFWSLDTESFINVTKSSPDYNNNVFSITNVSGQFITVFVVKTQLSGFDVPMITWYGSVQNMPPYVNATDYASDYMVDVIVVAGDYSNYQNLSVDPTFGKYFNTSGLIKGQLSNFANDSKVTLLKYYEGLSFIPYFRDSNGNNIFIEDVINNDTNKTGLFCTFNSDLFETDYPNGLVDLIGNGLVDSENMTIDFLSYEATIVETIEFDNVILDRPGNVVAIGVVSTINNNPHSYGAPITSGSVVNGNRTGYFGEEFVFNLTATMSVSGTSSFTVGFNPNNTAGAYAIINGTYLTLGTASFTVLGSNYPTSGVTASYITTYAINSSGKIVTYTSTSAGTNPTVGLTDVVLGYVTLSVVNNSIVSSVYTPVSVGYSGFVDLVYNTDYSVVDNGSGSFTVNFLLTANTPDVTKYAQYRKIKYFNNLINLLDSSTLSKMAIVYDSAMDKLPLSGSTVTNVVTSTTANKSFTLNTGLANGTYNLVTSGTLLFYSVDDEFIINSKNAVIQTKNSIADITGASSSGVASLNSKLYTEYYGGYINTGDYFWANMVTESTAPSSIVFANGTTGSLLGNSYIVFNGLTPSSMLNSLSVNNILGFPKSLSNKGTYTTLTDYTSAVSLATSLGYTASGSYAYEVSQKVVSETLTGVSTNIIYDINKQIFLSIYLDGNNNIELTFMDSTLSSLNPINAGGSNYSGDSISIQSDISNYRETVEIITNVTGYTQQPNQILVKGSRYANIAIGDFLEAYVDDTQLVEGQVAKKLTRVLTKRAYSGDPTLTVITCDSRIATYPFGDHYETTRYSSIDDYVSTYQAIPLKGFRIRQASLPDGTESTQNSILNLVANGTPLANALANKDALDFRYLIDSFGLGLTENSKQQLVDICGSRLDVFGFINMPSLKQFKNSSSPSFVDSNGVLQTSYIAQGGNLESNPAFLYSFASGAGVTCTGYFTPWVTVNDNGRPTNVPPAMFVATTYMRKQTSIATNITPWTIAAGVTNGKVQNIAGVEMNFDPQDISNLNLAQMNPIVLHKNRGYVIETENTAQTLYKSALSYIHVREVLIELERQLSDMLLDFQWKFNTADVRAEIKLRADVICETFVSKNGLYNYFNKCDAENNTATIIDNQIGVLDTYVEPIKGMGVIVNNITVLRTGQISSGGFINP